MLNKSDPIIIICESDVNTSFSSRDKSFTKYINNSGETDRQKIPNTVVI